MMDNHFKQKLDQHHIEWDKDELWQELEPQLPEPKSRLRTYWWMLLPLLLIPTCWGQHYLSEASSIASTNTDESVEVLSQPLETEEVQRPQQKEEYGSEVTVQNEEDLRVLPSVSVPQAVTASTTIAFSRPQLYPTEIIQEAADRLAKSPVITLSPKGNTSKKVINSSTSQETQSIPQRNKAVVLPLAQKPLAMVATASSNYPEIPNVTLSSPNQQETAPAPVKGAFVNVHAGLGTLNRQVKTNMIDPIALEHFTRHKNRETPEFAWNLNLEAGYRHQSGWSIHSGLGYQQLHETFFFDDVYRIDTVVTFFDRARYYVKPSGDTLFLSGPGYSTEVETRRIRHNNRVTYYQIPLFVGYHFPKNRFDIELAAGVHYLLAHQYQGRISEGAQVEIIDDPAFTLKSRWGYAMRLGVQYELFGSTHLYLATQYSRSPEFVRGDASQSYRSFGLQIGVQQRLR